MSDSKKLSPPEKFVRDTFRNGEEWMREHGIDPNARPPPEPSLEEIKREEEEMGIRELRQLQNTVNHTTDSQGIVKRCKYLH